MRIFTMTCDGRPAAIVRAASEADAVETAVDLAQTHELLRPGPRRRFEAREPNDAEMVEWIRHRADQLLLDTPAAA